MKCDACEQLPTYIVILFTIHNKKYMAIVNTNILQRVLLIFTLPFNEVINSKSK